MTTYKKHKILLGLSKYQREQLDALIEHEKTTATDVLLTGLARMYHDKIGVIESTNKRSK